MSRFAFVVDRIRVFAASALVLSLTLSLFPQVMASESSRPAAAVKFASAAESKAEYDRAVVPFFARHCLACHDAKASKGDLDLTALDPDMKCLSAMLSVTGWAAMSRPATLPACKPLTRRITRAAAA